MKPSELPEAVQRTGMQVGCNSRDEPQYAITYPEAVAIIKLVREFDAQWEKATGEKL